jgi:peptide/nickel transport system permease protein
MAVYVLRRLVAFVPTMLVISFLVFLMIQLVPGDPATLILGNEATATRVAELREQMGLDRPLLTQATEWYRRALTGDLGRSFYLDRSVVRAVGERLPLTFVLTAMGLFVSLAIGVPAGIFAALRHNTWIDTAVMALAVAGLSIPSFVLGLLLIYYVALPLPIFPTGGFSGFQPAVWDGIRDLTLPALSLGIAQASFIARNTRSSVLEVLSLDYVRTARSKGVGTARLIVRHALRNALMPIVTVAGLVVGILLGGAIVTETVFSLPGVGRLVISAVQRRDYPVIQGVILFITFAYLTVNLITDLLYATINPRLRYG